MERLWNKVVIKVERERGGVKGAGGGVSQVLKQNEPSEGATRSRSKLQEVMDGEGIYVDRVTYTIAIIPERTN